jgi:hypothetical protein
MTIIEAMSARDFSRTERRAFSKWFVIEDMGIPRVDDCTPGGKYVFAHGETKVTGG